MSARAWTGLWCLGLLLFPTRGGALEPDRRLTQYDLQAWTHAEGLPQSSIFAVLPARDGYLWLATQQCLARFDGHRFVRFRPSNEPAFRSGFITRLAEGPDGLWVGTIDGVVRQTGRAFRGFGTAEGLAKPWVRALLVDRKGQVWVGTDGGLQRLQGGRFGAPLVSDPPARVVALAEAEDGAIWAATPDRVYRVEPGGGPAGLGVALRVPDGVADLKRDPRPGGGILVVGGFGVGRVRSLATGFTPIPTGGAAISSVSTVHADGSGALWLGTQRDGLIRLRGGEREALSRAGGLPAQTVLAIAEDAEGTLWIGLDRGGLVRLSAGTFRTFGAPEGLPAEAVFSLHDGPSGELWTTSDLGLSRIEPSGRVETFGGPIPSGTGAFSSALHVDAGGDLVVGSFRDGLFAGRPGSFRRLVDGAELPSVRSILRDPAGVLFVGGARGLYRLEAGRLKREPSVSGAVFALEPDGLGGLFAATQEGLVALPAGGAARRVPAEAAAQGRMVVSLHLDGSGALWAGLIGAGLGLQEGGRLRVLREKDGLPSDNVYGVVEDGHGFLYLSGDQGVFRLARAEAMAFFRGAARTVQGELFARTDGLRNPECMGGVQPAAFRARDGRLWFATLAGAAVIDPSKRAAPPRSPRVVVEEARVDGHPYPPDTAVVAPPGGGRLEIAYAGLSLLAPERVRYRHRLLGFDPEWRDAGDRREAFYTNLPPGRYRFEVGARLGNGAWSGEAASLELVLRPRLYQTRGFLALALVSGGLAVLAAHSWRTLALRRRQSELERVVEERTRELRAANERLGEVNVQLGEANRSLERLSQVDGLTGLANRRRFDERLDAEWRRAQRSGEPLALALFDVDHFKAYNDGLGHPAGDACLRSVAGVFLEGVKRPADLAARYGGEEFVVLLPGLGPDEAAVFVEALRGRVESLALPHVSSSVGPHVTVSAGVASTRPKEGGTPDALLAAADAALYEAKRRGRNRTARAV